MAEHDKIAITVIVGSTREGRIAPVVVRWFAERAAQHDDVTIDVVDLVETPLPTVLPAFGQTPEPEAMEQLAAVTPRLAAADAFVLVTPEYNRSFPASLKNAIDWHNSQWHAKPVGFVSYGGISGGLRAVEHLRLVLAELHAVTVRDTVTFAGVWGKFDADGRMADPAADGAAKTMLDQLVWFGRALREARAARPYSA